MVHTVSFSESRKMRAEKGWRRQLDNSYSDQKLLVFALLSSAFYASSSDPTRPRDSYEGFDFPGLRFCRSLWVEGYKGDFLASHHGGDVGWRSDR